MHCRGASRSEANNKNIYGYGLFQYIMIHPKPSKALIVARSNVVGRSTRSWLPGSGFLSYVLRCKDKQ